MCRLSEALYGRKSRRRHKKMIPFFATLEGDAYGKASVKECTRKYKNGRPSTLSKGMHYHINICLRRPDFIDELTFELICRELWSDIDWAKPGIYVAERTGDCVSYALKDGPEALFLSSVSF